MITERHKLFKCLVNKVYYCKACRDNKVCEFMYGEKSVAELDCPVSHFVDGAREMINHLASIPLDKAIHFISDSVKEEE